MLLSEKQQNFSCCPASPEAGLFLQTEQMLLLEKQHNIQFIKSTVILLFRKQDFS